MNCARVLLADDHPAVRESVAALLGEDFDVVGMVANGQEMLSAAIKLRPDVVVADISMPLLNGIEAAMRLRSSDSKARVVFLTVHDEPEFIRACLAAGAFGYVLKRRLTSDLVTAVHETLAGHQFLSPGLHSCDERPEKSYPQ